MNPSQTFLLHLQTYETSCCNSCSGKVCCCYFMFFADHMFDDSGKPIHVSNGCGSTLFNFAILLAP